MQGFDNHRKLIFWELACWTIQVYKKLKYFTPHLLFDPGTAGDRWWYMSEGGKVAEGGTQSKRENSSSFCLPKVYPVVYTPRRAAAPRAEGATLWSKMNMWHIWLFSEREWGPLRLAVGGTPMCPFLFRCTRSGKGYRLLWWHPPPRPNKHTPALPASYCESMSP